MRSASNQTSRQATPIIFVVGLLLAWSASSTAAVIQEDFASDPRLRGWRGFGDTNLHRWNAAQRHLEVTWDSSRSNSFLALPLGTILGKSDEFSFGFDVRLSDIRPGSTPGKPGEFPIAVGLLNSTNFTRTNYYAGTGINAAYGIRNAVEFGYFPDAGFGETFSSIVASAQNNIYYAHNFPLAMTAGDTFRIALAVSNRVLRTTALRNGVAYGGTFPTILLASANDFRVDTFAIINYSDAVQVGPPGSVLAHGVVDNITLTVPLPPVRNLVLRRLNGVPEASLNCTTNWSYRLERSGDLINWQPASAATMGNGAVLILRDASPSASATFYRVEATRP